MDEAYEANWRTESNTSSFGPTPAFLTEVSVPSLPVGTDETSWRYARIIASLDFWIDKGLNYCHHHIPLWTPPDDAYSPTPYFRLSSDPATMTCTAFRSVTGEQTTSALSNALIQWNGVDCSDFTSWVYNFAFGVAPSATPLQTGISTQACNGKVPNRDTPSVEVKGDAVLLNINHTNYSAYGALLKPGDLLYILKDSDPNALYTVHVIVWTGLKWGDIKRNPAYYKEMDDLHFGAIGDRVGGDFKGYGTVSDDTPLIVDSHHAGPAYRPFIGWYRKHLSHVRRVINAEASRSDVALAPLIFPEWGVPVSGVYKSTPSGNASQYLEYNPAAGAEQSCLRPNGFNDGSL